MWTNFAFVALGGAFGAMSRYGAGLLVSRMIMAPIPLGVICVNIVGSFLMGAFAVFAAKRGFGHLSPLVMTGFLGGFTTFSAFSLEAVTLYERGEFAAALSYVLISVVGSLLALAVGAFVMRLAF